MSIIPPPPPPPPNLSSPLVPPKQYESPSYSDPNDCEWASDCPDLQEACRKNKICLYECPYKYKYKHFEPIAQVGPMCGMVALSMLLDGKITANEMLTISKLEGYSNNGEMFSCKNMVQLAEKVVRLAEIDNITFYLKKGNLFSHETIELLLSGAVLLVPYDADFNHSPCLKQGHTAHWALVCGVIITNEPSTTSYEADTDKVFVLCRHGKSKYVAAWNLDELDKSNKNLYQFSPKRGCEDLVYVLPEGGVGGDNGLRDQFVVFKEL